MGCFVSTRSMRLPRHGARDPAFIAMGDRSQDAAVQRINGEP